MTNKTSRENYLLLFRSDFFGRGGGPGGGTSWEQIKIFLGY